ncbi:MAG: CbrC family protein [Gemmatimonadaceae bacterium]
MRFLPRARTMTPRLLSPRPTVSDALPEFRHHSDMLASGSIVASTAACPCCERSRGFAYTGPVCGHSLGPATSDQSRCSRARALARARRAGTPGGAGPAPGSLAPPPAPGYGPASGSGHGSGHTSEDGHGNPRAGNVRRRGDIGRQDNILRRRRPDLGLFRNRLGGC